MLPFFLTSILTKLASDLFVVGKGITKVVSSILNNPNAITAGVTRAQATTIARNARSMVDLAKRMTRNTDLTPRYGDYPRLDSNFPGDNRYVHDVVLTYSYEDAGVIKRDTVRFDVIGSMPMSQSQAILKAIELLRNDESPYPRSSLPSNYSIDYERLYLLRAYFH